MNAVLQYYELNGTQWPAEPSFPAFAGGVVAAAGGSRISSAPESILFKAPGEAGPVDLITTTKETYFQLGNQPAGPLEEGLRLPAGMVGDPNQAFGTESCAGCHFSAGACIGFKRD
jgi:hypothetical protein